MSIILKVATEFSRTPGARYSKEGEFSGELFRTKYLSPKLEEAMRGNTKLIVDLDGTSGYGTSFLEEAFGGLIRNGITNKQICENLDFISNEDPSYIEEIKEYISDALNHESH